jgi:hypothetical protein
MGSNEGQVDDFGPGVFCKGQGKAPTTPTRKTRLRAQHREGARQARSARSTSATTSATGTCFKGVIPPVPAIRRPERWRHPDLPLDGGTRPSSRSTRSARRRRGAELRRDHHGPKPYADGSTWVTLVDAVIEGNQSQTYCARRAARSSTSRTPHRSFEREGGRATDPLRFFGVCAGAPVIFREHAPFPCARPHVTVGLGADRGGLGRAPFPEGDPMTRLANLCAVSAVLALSFAGSARDRPHPERLRPLRLGHGESARSRRHVR